MRFGATFWLLFFLASPVFSETDPMASDAAAQVRLGLAHLEGDGVALDEARAAELFRKAAQQDNADGQFNLGLLYIRGAGVSKDDVQSYKWLTIAHERGRSDALAVRDSMAGRMTPEQLYKARSLARSWKPGKP